jgi:hypothetical protein
MRPGRRTSRTAARRTATSSTKFGRGHGHGVGGQGSLRHWVHWVGNLVQKPRSLVLALLGGPPGCGPPPIGAGGRLRDMVSAGAGRRAIRSSRSKEVPNAIKAAPNPDFCFCAAEKGPYQSILETKNRGLVRLFIAISHNRLVLTLSDIELILKSMVNANNRYP